jgi:16S rRNA C967 or C1407 C5-methylase (RsmB/RsmF family)
VLRRFLRERAAQVAQAERRPEAAWNHPAWWVAQVQADWPEHWQTILGQARLRPPMALRVNARRCTVPDYLARLQAAGLSGQAVAGPGWDQAIVLDAPVPVERLPGFAEGWVSVQDLAAQRAAPLLLGEGLPAGARVLDACAAPGGKTAHLLELADLDLLALDADPARLARVGEGLRAWACGPAPRPPTPVRWTPGGTASPSTPSCWTRPARPRASCAATPTSPGCAARGHPGPGAHPGRAAGRAVAAAQAGRAAALRHLFGLQGRGAGADRRVFATPWPVTGLHLPGLSRSSAAAAGQSGRNVRTRPVARADGFFYALLGKPAASGSAS